MFTDMVGFSARTQADEATALSVLDEHNRILRPVLSGFHGREVKAVGDGFLVEFESALDAVRCALDIQQALRSHNAGSPEERQIRIRIGIHVGDVVEANGDLFGDAVNIASRIEPLAQPGGICFTQQVYDQVQNKISSPIARLPPVALKNIRLPTPVYKIAQPGETQTVGAPGAQPAGIHNLAVLPLASFSPDPADEYFADGLTEELISTLSQVNGLSVIARTSVFPYKSAPKSIAQVGAELGVDTVLEGSVRKAGNRIRITLQMVDAATQRHIWACSYNREMDDVFAVQADIATRTAEALSLEFSKAMRPGIKKRPAVNPEAYDCYLRGLVAASRPREGFAEAVHCFEQATKLDPTFAEAFAAWANLYVVVAGDQVSMLSVIPRAKELAGRALELDPDSSEAHSSLGNIALQFDRDWQLAEDEFRKAISLNPSNVTAHNFLGLLLMALQRYEEAMETIRRSIQLDPGGNHQRGLAWAELESGNFDAAIGYGKEECERHPASVHAHVFLGLSYVAAGRRAEALHEADTPLTGANEDERFDHALLNALVGRPDAARAIAAETERGEARSYTSAAHLAMLYAATGEKAKALDLLEKDYREGDRILWLYYSGAFFDSIRDDPRFVALLQAYRVPTRTPRVPPPGS
jgi:TolB-like protein/cytochrome c-type biogenesis protein CcmH/NrfG